MIWPLGPGEWFISTRGPIRNITVDTEVTTVCGSDFDVNGYEFLAKNA